MKFVISGGGTAGHINPALALSSALIEQGHEVTFIGTPNGMEARLVKDAGINYVALQAAGFNRSKPWTLITSTLKILYSSAKAKTFFKNWQPDGIVGFGGYVSLPVGLAGSTVGIPLMIHEQNSVPGIANLFLANHGAKVCATFACSRKYFKDVPDERFLVTGNPVRDQILHRDGKAAREALGIPADAQVLLIFGGSLGAKHLNTAVLDKADAILASNPNLHVIHGCGRRDYAELSETYTNLDERWHLLEYIDNMGDVMDATDLIVSRAGSTSLSEIAVVGLPSILVPFPQATDDHQTVNARDFEECGAGVLIADSKVDSDEFLNTIISLINDDEKRAQMRAAALTLGKPNATQDLLEQALALAEK